MNYKITKQSKIVLTKKLINMNCKRFEDLVDQVNYQEEFDVDTFKTLEEAGKAFDNISNYSMIDENCCYHTTTIAVFNLVEEENIFDEDGNIIDIYYEQLKTKAPKFEDIKEVLYDCDDEEEDEDNDY